MRGKAGTPAGGLPADGITPAYAGKSGLRSKVERNDGDHPRLCGEKHRARCTRQSAAGSPPPMRGKVFIRVPEMRAGGITPAYAGKRQRPRSNRECWIGSPPPMRGKENRWTNLPEKSRITPAYAGKSPLFLAIKSLNWDHPRLCGEKR